MKLSEMEKIPNFVNHKFVYHMMDPKDWTRHYNEGTQVVNDFILPRGPRQKDEFSDTVYHEGATVPYHQHKEGYETFEIARGSVDCIVNGKHFIAKAGDIIHLPPYTAHGFVFLEEGTIWRELFQEIDMSGGIDEKNMVNTYFSEYREDSDFMEMYRGGRGLNRNNLHNSELPLVDHTQVFQCRTPDFAWVKHDGEGYSIKLKVCKFETGGAKEIWHADLKKGLCADYLYPHKGYDVFYVQHGKIEVTVHQHHGNSEPQVFIAGDESIIDIPPYHTYTLRVLEDTAMYNYGGEYDLQACLEDMAMLKATDPHALDTEDARLAFLRKYGVYATSVAMEK